MSEKFENFVAALRLLCLEHDVRLTGNRDGTLDAEDLPGRDEDPIYLGLINDLTTRERDHPAK